jgi:hypothetical protein
MRRLVSLVALIPLVPLLAACGGDHVAAVAFASSTSAVNVAASSTGPIPGLSPATSEWAYAPGARAKAVANVGSATNGHGKERTVTRVLVADAKNNATRQVRYVNGAWALPVPVSGGATEGLSWNGRVAVMQSTDVASRLIAFRLRDGRPQIVDLRREGTFGFDALSTNGTKLYLTQYRDATGAAVDRIRLYDLATQKLDPTPVVDKLEGDDSMVGTPVARTWSADGGTVYTVYEGSAHPFVHTLQTAYAFTFCTDLPARGNPTATGTWTVRLNNRRKLITTSDRLAKSFLIDLQTVPPRVENVTDLSATAPAP